MKTKFTLCSIFFISLASFSQVSSKYGDMQFPNDGEGHPRVTENTKTIYVDADPNSYGGNLAMDCSNFSDGVAWYQEPVSKKWGLIDTLGNVLKAPYLLLDFGQSLPKFVNGKAYQSAPRGEKGYYLINKKGDVLKKLPEIAKIEHYNLKEGYAGVLYYGDFYKGNKYGFIDFEGKEIYPVTSETRKYADAPVPYDFCDGLAPFFKQTTQKWGYINREGEIVIEPQFNKAQEFSDGLAAVRLNDKWGYIDSKGNVVIDYKFTEKPEKFNCGLAIAYKANSFVKCVIDKQGAIIKEFNKIKPFNGLGLALAEMKVKGYRYAQTVLINTNFEMVSNFGELPLICVDDKPTIEFHDDFYVLSPDGYTAEYVTDIDLKVIFKGYNIETFCDNLAFVLFDEPDKPRQSAYVNAKGEIVILFKTNEF